MGPFDFFLPPVFDTLPEAVAERLLLGVVAPKQAAEIGLAALTAASGTPFLADLGRELIALAFDLDPFNAELARALPTLAGASLDAATRAALDATAVADWLDPWRAAWKIAAEEGDWDAFLRRFDATWPSAGAPLAGRVEGLAALAADDRDRLERWLSRLEQSATPGLAWLGAEAALRLGRTEEGAHALFALLARWPWCINALLRLHDLQNGLADRREPLPGDLAIALYTFNKADDLGATLEDILASRLERFRVCVLDNGSADATPDVLAAFRDRFGADRFHTVRAPVNVGAPAGRNWLKALPEVFGADFVAYLDDDLALPPDWALRLGAAVAARPGAGVYGCRVVEAVRPAVLQSIAVHLAPAGPGQPVAASDLALQAPDLGQWTYCGPAASVTGCCHLFAAKALAAGGDFDIRFSPSQFDDFDRDLRAALAGQPAVYQGHLAVGHKRRSGESAQRQRLAGANAHGNLLKLQAKYDAGQVRRLRRAQRDWLLTDVRRKAVWLARHSMDDVQ